MIQSQIGFEIWTMQNNILFDNIYIGHSIEDAEKLAKDTYDVKIAVEKAEEDALAPKRDDKKTSTAGNFMEDPVAFVREKVDLFVNVARNDPVQAIKLFPEVAGGMGVLAVTALALLVSLIGMTSGKAPSKAQVKDAAEKVKEAAVDAKDKVAEAVSTGTEKVQGEIEKRKTRSSTAAAS